MIVKIVKDFVKYLVNYGTHHQKDGQMHSRHDYIKNAASARLTI